jgi:hypothetical protein
MPEPVTRTPDFPDFDTYPGATPSSGRMLPPAQPQSQSGMNNAAERVGSAVGSAVVAARRLPQQINSSVSSTLSSMKDRLVLVKGRGVREVNARAGDLKEAAGNTARNAQERARYIASEYPLHVVAGVAAVAFLAGFGLRIWRGSRG